MAFRRQRDKWDDFIRRHGEELQACGIPREIFSKKHRFLSFLSHAGFDEAGWFEHPHGYVFDSGELSDDQVQRLGELVEKHVDPYYGRKICEDWMRYRQRGN
jgi:hypothetical protein